MLAIIEHSLEKPALNGTLSGIAIYQTIPDHVNRLRGRAMDHFGPSYSLSENRKLKYQGQMKPAEFENWIHDFLMRSALFLALSIIYERSLS